MQGVFRDSSGHAREKGFTLIEIAIGMIIIGLLAVPYLQTYQAWKLKTITKETSDNASAVQSALAKYATRYGHYPLPANPSLASGAAGDGVEVAVGGVGTCSLASTGVCRSTTTWTGAHGQTTVLIGTVPYATLGLPLKNTYDGYKNRFKYAVTELMTKAPPTYTFSNDDGILQVVDKDGNDEDSQTKPDWQFCSNQNSNCNFTGNQQVLYGTSITDSTKYFIKQNMTSTPCTDAIFGDPHVGQLKKCWVAPMPKAHAKHFVIISHGADRKGSFSLAGIQTVPCTPLTAPQAKDDINCRNTPIYNSNKASDGSGGRSTPLDANHYDDYILSTATLEQGSWVQKTGQTDVYSNLTASGNILISPSLTYNGSGVVAPEARLQVEGGDLKANNFRINRLCPTGGCATASPTTMPSVIPAETFTPQSISGKPDYDQANKPGYGISCGNVTGDAGAMTGIAKADEKCLNVAPSGLDLGTVCASGKVSHGTDASGHLICSDF